MTAKLKVQYYWVEGTLLQKIVKIEKWLFDEDKITPLKIYG